jgi:hypothetical protein
MSGAAWRKFTSTPAFTLSSDPGRKIVFVQVGRSPAISTTVAKISEPISTTRLSTDFVPAPTIVSPVASDTIFLGLPDLKSSVTLPAAVHDNTRFEFEVIVSNAGMPTPPNGVINVYNSFVTNTISLELVEVPFGVGRLAGKGCVITDVSTIECTLAPMVHDAAVAIQVTASVVRGLTASQTQATHTLRTRITGITESNTTNNWRDTPITIVR